MCKWSRYVTSGQTRGERNGRIFVIPPAKAKEIIKDRHPSVRRRPRSLLLSLVVKMVSTLHKNA